MVIEHIELQWRCGARLHRLVVDAEGTPTLTTSEGTAALPSDTALSRVATSPPAPSGPARRGKAWTEEEEGILREGFEAAEPPAELARRVGRTKGAVTARLVRLGLISEEEAGLRYPVRPKEAEGEVR